MKIKNINQKLSYEIIDSGIWYEKLIVKSKNDYLNRKSFSVIGTVLRDLVIPNDALSLQP